jgi:hypothetical protein
MIKTPLLRALLSGALPGTRRPVNRHPITHAEQPFSVAIAIMIRMSNLLETVVSRGA